MNFLRRISDRFSRLVGFALSLAASPFAREITQTAVKKSAGLVENLVFGAGVALTALGLTAAVGPVGAIVGALGAGLIIKRVQNRLAGRRTRLLTTATTSAGIAAGLLTGAAFGSAFGPVGTAVGAGLGALGGGFAGQILGDKIAARDTASPLDSSPLSPVVRFGDGLSGFLAGSLLIPFRHVLVPTVICLLVVFALSGRIRRLFTASFIIPNAAHTAGAPSLPLTSPLPGASSTPATPPKLPPPGKQVKCFHFNETSGPFPMGNETLKSLGWAGSADFQTISQVIALLSRSSSWSRRVCAGGTIRLTRVAQGTSPWGGWAPSSSTHDIILYDRRGIGSFDNAVWVLAHETGHLIYYHNPDAIDAFRATQSEGFLPTYPGAKQFSEDFAETIGVYLSSKRGVLSRYPRHKAFGKYIFGFDY